MMRYCALAAALCLGKLLAAPLNAAADLPRQLEEIRERHGIAVVATALAAGNAPVEPLILGADADTPLRWGSITKTITAMTVLTLAEQGKVSLQAPLQRYVDASHWGNPWRDSHPVRVIDLLEMRAGLPDLSAREFAYNQPLTLTQALALDPQHRYSRWPPGSQHVYSNMTAGLTQLLI
jgi:CubicO group peptidase (beta-lactamase class C family)